MHSEQSCSGPNSAQPSDALFGARAASIPLFHAAWLFAVGIVFAHWLWLRPSFVLIGVLAAALLCALAAFRAQRIVWLAVALQWILLGAWCATAEPHPAPAAALAAFSDNLLREIEGTVVESGSMRSEADLNDPGNALTASSKSSQQHPEVSWQIDLRVASVEAVNDDVDEQQATSGTVRLTVRGPAPKGGDAASHADTIVPCGERIRVAARLLRPQAYHDPGVWSREEYLLDQGITSTASVDLNSLERLGPSSESLLGCRLHQFQHRSSDRLLTLPAIMQRLPAALRLSHDDAIMLAAMITGDRTYLSHSLRVGFERTGSFHMLVVSGFHLAIFAGCIFWVANRIHLPPLPATVATILISCGYALFTGFATPVQRALWMVTLYLAGRLLYRNRTPLNTIGFAALCLMAASPLSLFDSSLQMTLIAVVSIAGIAAPLLRATIHSYLAACRALHLTALDAHFPPRVAAFRVGLRSIAKALESAASYRIAWSVFPGTIRFCFRAAELLIVSTVVELAMTLPMAIYFHRITVFALPVNAMILPLLFVLMPAALLTLLLALLWPAAAVVPAMAVALPLHCSVGMVKIFGAMSLGDLRIPSPSPPQTVLFFLSLAIAIFAALSVGWQRRLAWVALGLAALAVVFPRPVQHPHDALLVEAIDVGQGDSILLIAPDGKTLLIDGGGLGGGQAESAQNFDVGEEVVSQALWARGIRHLDAVALTHAHSDHMGGLPAILRNFHPAELWVGNNPHVAPYNALLEEAASLHIALRTLRAGDALTLGQISIGVLAPFPGYEPGLEPANNDSLVLRASYRSTAVLLEGDAEGPVEKAMLSEPNLRSALLKVGHHGSLTSTHPEFLARVAPQWAVISCGARNRYHHPRGEILAELQAAGVRTFRTDLNGATCFRLDGATGVGELPCSP
jgi:competence protein ComEC